MARQPPAARRQRDPERTKARILEAATDEFAAHGYAGARVSEIAARAGANKQLISYYFGGKEGLYRAITEQWLQDQHEAAPEQRDMTIGELSASFISPRPQDRKLARLLIWEGLTYDTDDPGAHARTARMDAGVEDLRRRQAAGELPAELDMKYFLLMSMAAALAPVALPHVARSIFGPETDPGSPEFMERFVEEYRKLIDVLSRQPPG
ncbi:TetR/AcrR family transcriptional regulator [Flindersiella endophytica]